MDFLSEEESWELTGKTVEELYNEVSASEFVDEVESAYKEEQYDGSKLFIEKDPLRHAHVRSNCVTPGFTAKKWFEYKAGKIVEDIGDLEIVKYEPTF